MKLDLDSVSVKKAAFWCLFCSKSHGDLVPGPFHFVEEIPARDVATKEERKRHLIHAGAATYPNPTCSGWVCERCCKKLGLIW